MHVPRNISLIQDPQQFFNLQATIVFQPDPKGTSPIELHKQSRISCFFFKVVANCFQTKASLVLDPLALELGTGHWCFFKSFLLLFSILILRHDI